VKQRRVSECNPFSTRFVQPGAIPYRFAGGQRVEGVINKIRSHGWRGAIIGAHGSGKSTLVATLSEALSEAGVITHRVSLHDGAWRLPASARSAFAACQRDSEQHVLVVDGYEQLGFPARAWLRSACRRRRMGLIVTAHRPVSVPTVFDTTVSARTAQWVVDRLLVSDAWNHEPHELAERLIAHRGNLRELLFELYDRYETERRRFA
jgi:ABC-type cobalamin/Fe3+-siderophores transport system ATPase subunit